MTAIYWIAVIAYCLAMVFVGWRLRRRAGEHSQMEFWLANRELPGWLQNSYGYNYLAFGVLLGIASTIVVSLLTKHSRGESITAVQSTPVDDRTEFIKSAGSW